MLIIQGEKAVMQSLNNAKWNKLGGIIEEKNKNWKKNDFKIYFLRISIEILKKVWLSLIKIKLTFWWF